MRLPMDVAPGIELGWELRGGAPDQLAARTAPRANVQFSRNHVVTRSESRSQRRCGRLRPRLDLRIRSSLPISRAHADQRRVAGHTFEFHCGRQHGAATQPPRTTTTRASRSLGARSELIRSRVLKSERGCSQVARLEGKRSLKRLVMRTTVLNHPVVDESTAVLAAGLPPEYRSADGTLIQGSPSPTVAYENQHPGRRPAAGER
jgi:hypothetical protein